ncbi:MAG: glutamate--tRNA ligase family protein, partial [Halobacteria archaeon]|nr:glutamate--tRNA ligase family protein [Halobacteria archaeon]
MEKDEDEVRELVEKYALQNAVDHGEDAEVGAVMGKLMGEHPELRDDADEVSEVAPEVVASVNRLGHEERSRRLEEIAPELVEELRRDDGGEDDSLADLPGAEEGDVVMRFAPNPNGPPTLGSARGIVVNSEYVDRYDGELVLRFDDTDPVNKPPLPDAYDWYVEDAEWLGADFDEVVRASDRLDVYYDHARRLIEEGGAYVCECSQDEFQELKKEGEACEHRSSSVDENTEKWEDMLDGDYAEGEAVLRVRTEIDHKNP